MMYVISRACINDICGYFEARHDSNYTSGLGTISQFWGGTFDGKHNIKHVFIFFSFISCYDGALR